MISSNSFGSLKQAEGADVELAFLAGRRGFGADAAGGRLRVLLLDGVGICPGRDAQRQPACRAAAKCAWSNPAR